GVDRLLGLEAATSGNGPPPVRCPVGNPEAAIALVASHHVCAWRDAGRALLPVVEELLPAASDDLACMDDEATAVHGLVGPVVVELRLIGVVVDDQIPILGVLASRDVASQYVSGQRL